MKIVIAQIAMVSFLMSKAKNSSIADDILQESFIKIHTKLHTLKDFNKLKS